MRCAPRIYAPLQLMKLLILVLTKIYWETNFSSSQISMVKIATRKASFQQQFFLLSYVTETRYKTHFSHNRVGRRKGNAAWRCYDLVQNN